MGIRDKELEKLENYCKALGINLIYTESGDAGCWSHTPPEIEINTKHRIHRSKTMLILSLLHETAHHVYYQHHGKPDIPIESWDLENERPRGSDPIPKAERRKIYQYEKNGIPYMAVIARELDIRIPQRKIDMQVELDIWAYEFYYEEGRFPNRRESLQKRKELRERYANNATRKI